MIMKQRIHLRMEKVIDYAVKAFIREHHKDHKEYSIHEIADGITMKMIKQLNLEGGKGANYFLESIYEKLENFDHLMWNAMPDGENKHNFWESTLILERAKDLIRKDISGELDNMAYEQEIEHIPKRQVKKFRPDLDWRTELINGLGIK